MLLTLMLAIYALPDNRRDLLVRPFLQFLGLSMISRIALVLLVVLALIFAFFTIASLMSVLQGGEPGNLFLSSIAMLVAMFLSTLECIRLARDIHGGRIHC